MTIVPFAPMSPEILLQIVDLKLSKLRARIWNAHRAETVFSPELADELARRCSEAETGARNIDHVLRGGLMPVLSREILTRLAEEKPIRSVKVGLSGDGFDLQLG